MRLELTRVGFLVELANDYTTRGVESSLVRKKVDAFFPNELGRLNVSFNVEEFDTTYDTI